MEKPNLNKLETAVVNTSTIEELNNLMQIYELSGFKWAGDQSPIEGAYSEKRIEKYGRETCINSTQGYLTWGPKKIYADVLSFQEFCKKSKITQENLEEIKKFFK